MKVAKTRYVVTSLVAAGLLAACSGGKARATTPAQSPTTPTAYHIVYMVSISGSPVETESLWIMRPFDSLDQILAGPPPGGSFVLATASRLGEQVVQSSDSRAGALLYVPAAAAQYDVQLALVRTDAIQEHRIEVMGNSQVLGRPCRIYRSAVSLRETGPLAGIQPGTYVDTCIDAEGLVLSEVDYQAGKLTETRQAVSVQVGAHATVGANFNMSGESTPFDEGGGSFHHLTATSAPPGPSWAPSWLPPGYDLAGKYDVVPAQPQAFESPDEGPPNPLGLPGSLVTELDDVYVSGPDVIVLEQGGTLNGAKFAAPSGGTQVTLGKLGSGQLTLTPDGPAITAEPAQGFHFVRLTGTVPPDQLLRVAASLVPQGPGTLVTIPTTAPG